MCVCRQGVHIPHTHTHLPTTHTHTHNNSHTHLPATHTEQQHPHTQNTHTQRIRAVDYQLFPHVKVGEAAKDLIRNMLVKDTSKRYTIQQIFKHPFFTEGLPPGVAEMNYKLVHNPNVPARQVGCGFCDVVYCVCVCVLVLVLIPSWRVLLISREMLGGQVTYLSISIHIFLRTYIHTSSTHILTSSTHHPPTSTHPPQIHPPTSGHTSHTHYDTHTV